jgi:hypothetical protein
MKKKENILKATHQGSLNINGFNISCAVLENGERILVNRSLADAFGIKGSGSYWQKKKDGEKGALLPEYLSAKYLQPFIKDEHKLTLYNTVSYINKSGVETEGVDATFLSDICDIYVKAGQKGAFKNSPEIPENAYNLLLSLSKVAIIALVDEATGYQYDREKDELQKILSAYISKELLPWQKRFPDEFYIEIFRLNGWDYTVNGIKKRPGVIGTWTKKLIYNLLPKGVLEELERNTPKSEAGNKTKRLHQGLTLDIGEPHLERQLISVITLMNISANWKEFLKVFAKKFQKDLIELAKSADVKHIKPTKQISGQQYLFVNQEEQPTEINERQEKLSDFNTKLKTALNYNPKK